MIEDISKYDHPFENFSLDDESCFLCGVNMGQNVTREDVFPKWLQRKHNLSNKRLILINGTEIRYSQLTIPCCPKCNNEYLSDLEKKIAAAINSGYDECLTVDPVLIFLWGAKILYGILRKELILPIDRSNPQKGSIVPERLVQTYDDLHCFMQGIRRSMEFIGSLPFSVLIANLHDLGDVHNYYFRDNIISQTISIRSGEVGIIIAFADAGVNNHSYSRYLEEVNGRKIHPIQFDELYAKVTYESHRLLKTPYFTVVANEDHNHPIQVITQLPSGYVMKDWDQEEFAMYLKNVMQKWNVPIESYFVPPNRVHTFLTNDDGSLMFISENGE